MITNICQLWILKSSGVGCDLWMLEVEEVTAWCKEKALAMPRLCTCTDSPCALDSGDTDKRKRNQFGLTQHIQIIQQYSTCWSSGAIHLIIMVSSRISSRILSEERNYIYIYVYLVLRLFVHPSPLYLLLFKGTRGQPQTHWAFPPLCLQRSRAPPTPRRHRAGNPEIPNVTLWIPMKNKKHFGDRSDRVVHIN